MTLRQWLGLLGPLRGDVAAVACLTGLFNALLLSPVVYMLQIYDRVLVSGNLWTLAAVSALTLGSMGVMALADWLRSRMLVRISSRIDHRMCSLVAEANFDAARAGSPLASPRAQADLLHARQWLTSAGITSLLDAPWAILYIAVAYVLHPALGALAAAFAIVQVGMAWWGSRAAAPSHARATQALIEADRFLTARFRSLEIVEALGMGRALAGLWRERDARALETSLEAQSIGDRHATIGRWIRYSQQSLSLAAGAILVVLGELSPGGMIAANLLVSRALAPIEQLSTVWRQYGLWAGAVRLARLLEAFPKRSRDARIPDFSGHVQLRNVIARAPGRNAPLLQIPAMEFSNATVTVVVGASGAGKSTFVQALLGVWPQLEGEVRWDGQDAHRIAPDERARHVGYLPQEPELFHGTVAENIARHSGVDAEAVLAATRITGVHELILRLPQGYETPADSQFISAGQRQRIALARAVYGLPRLVVLDEPNAHLDDAGESALNETLRTLRSSGCTVVITSHRSGVLSVADQVLWLRDGEVAGYGPPGSVVPSMRPIHPPRSA